MTTQKNGLYDVEELFRYKKLFTNIPESFVECNNNVTMIMPKLTQDAVIYRQKHKVLGKMNKTEFISKIIVALNRLSPTTIKSVSDELSQIETIATYDGIDFLVDAILKRVVIEPQYIEVNAKLCSILPIRISYGNAYITPKSYIATRCQEIFNSYYEQKNINAILLSDNILDKNKLVNYAKFIGICYNLGIFKVFAVDSCIEKILPSIPKIPYGIDFSVAIISTVRDNYKINHTEKLKKYFDDLYQIKNLTGIQKKDMFAIMDLLGI